MRNSKHSPKKILLSAFICLIISCGFALHAPAQITKTKILEITPASQIIELGPYLHIYEQNKGQNNSYSTILAMHAGEKKAPTSNKDIINLGMSGNSAWMIVTIKNNSYKENWYLDFGTPGDGRYSLAYRLWVRDATNKQSVVRALREPNRMDGFGDSFIREAVPIHINKNQTIDLLIFYEPESALLNSIVPKLITQETYLKKLGNGDAYSMAIRGIFVAIIVTFFILAYIFKNRLYTLFSYYFLTNALFYILVSENFFVTFDLLNELILGTFYISALLGIFATRFFLGITKDKSDNKIFYAIALIPITAAILSLISDINWLSSALLYLPNLATSILLCVIAFIYGEKGKFAAHFVAGAWFFNFVGLLITALCAFKIIGINQYIANAYIISLIPQALLFTTAILKRAELTEIIERRQLKNASKNAEEEAKLRHVQETEEQARLLRVIEREREMMGELREREAQRAEEMRLAKEAADQANAAKSAFLAVVSHEIRTPMTGILGMLRLLHDTQLSRQQYEYTTAIQESGDTMMALLNDILDFEKIESGNMELEHIDFNLHKVINGIVMLMSGHAAEKQVYLKAEILDSAPKFVKGDPTRLRQIILNLVNNAIKFTERGGVTIELSGTASIDPGTIETTIKVIDTGIGISPEGQKKLFNPFEQAEKSTTRKYGGTGLGLAICKHLVEAMGSSIQINSQEGEGSTFYFTVNFASGDAQSAEAATTSKTSFSMPIEQTPSLKIMVIEDNEMNRRVMKGLLEKGKHKVTTANDGTSALKILDDENFQIILTDINMDGMSGTEFTKAVRNLDDPQKSKIPIIALTGNTDKDEIQSYYDAGVNGYLSKPVDPDKLAQVILDAYNKQNVNELEIQDQPENNIKTPETPSLENDDLEILKEDLSSSHNEDIKKEQQEQDHNAIFDTNMLQGLKDSLGVEAFTGLLNGYQVTADNLINALQEQIQEPEQTAITARAHELKGMAANFGVSIIADLAEQAEESTKAGNLDRALGAIKKLPEANEQARAALKDWTEES